MTPTNCVPAEECHPAPSTHACVPLRLLQLMAEWNVQIPNRQLDQWRLTWPNVGELQGFPQLGVVRVMATNGILALFDIDHPEALWLGHLAAFTGPVAKEYVAEGDWDYEKRKRVVRVFRRADDTYAIIPQDSWMDDYWTKHTRSSKEELQALDALGGGQITLADFNTTLEQLSQKSEKPKTRQRSRMQQVMDML